jgi:hypothetical protein
MYLDKLPGLQAGIGAYHERTLKGEIYWSVARPVPTAKRSERGDYWFSHGRFMSDSHGEGSTGADLAVFMTNPSERFNLCNPHGFMLMRMPGLTLAELVHLFHSYVRNDGGAIVPLGRGGKRVRVIKGVVVPESSHAADDAMRFNFGLNKEIAKLYYLAHGFAHLRFVRKAETEFMLLELSGFPS